MKKVKLTGLIGKGKYTFVDNDDFDRVSKYKWHLSSNKNYVLRQVWDKKNKTTHALMLSHFIFGNLKKGLQIDHINRNKLDNRKINLRSVTNGQNQANVTRRKNNTSGFKGVHFNTGHKKWSALIGFNGKRYSLGYFKKPIEAALAYNVAAQKFFGRFALLNKV